MDNSIMDKIIKVHFEQDEYYIWGIKGLEQWDKCQKLEISGLDISDEIVEVHFSLDEVKGKAERMYGTVKDGVIHADIPVFILEGPEYLCSNSEVYNAYAWVFVSDDESAETIRKMEFEIKARPKPNGYASPDKQDPFLQEIRRVMNETKDIAQSVRDDADAGKFNGNASINQEALLQLAIKPTTEKASFHHITDSANMKVVDFGMEGKTEQETTSGKNFANPKSITDGFLSASDGTILTSYGKLYKIFKQILPIGSYTIHIIDNKICISRHIINGTYTVLDSIGMTKYTFTVDDMSEIIICFSKESGVFDDTEEIQIELGTVATDYEPYTNGPSPNPDSPQEIVNAGVYNEETGRYEIGCRVANKNLLDYTEVVDNYRNKNYIQTASGYIVTSLQFKPNTQYYMKVNGTRSTWATFLISTQEVVNGSVAKAIGISNTWDSEKCVTTDETGLIYFGIAYPVDNHLDRIEQTLKEYLLQIEIGSSATPYKPHDSKTFTLTSPVPLTKWDYLTKRDGVWGWSIYHLYFIFDGTEPWMTYAGRSGFMTDQILPEIRTNGYGYANWLSVNGTHKKDMLSIGLGSKTIYATYSSFYDSTLEDKGLANWKAYLVENPLEVWTYSTTTEQAFHPLPDEEQTLLNNLETYYGVTNLYNDQGCPMWLTYVADTKLYTDQQIAKQIAQTQALILEN